MNGNSKREMVNSVLRRRMRAALAAYAFDKPSKAEALREVGDQLVMWMADEIANDPYHLKELADVFDWKKPPKV